MTDREIEQKLQRAVAANVPDVLARVMARCDDQKGQVIEMPKKKNVFLKFAAIAAALALILGIGFFTANYFGNTGVASVITLDVNPSIELRLNKDARVLEANALNDDAAKVLEGMDLKGTDLTTATNAIIGSLLKHGYLDQLANAILISVEDKDSARGTALQQSISEEVDQLLTAASMHANVLSQYVTGNVETLSNTHHISHGKAALIEQLIAANPSYTPQELSQLSVQELSLLLENPKNHVVGVNSTGTTNEGAYIGREKAKTIAFEDAGVAEADVIDLDVDFDYEQGILVYEVDFECGRNEYEYDINAVSGEIVRSRTEEEGSHSVSGNTTPSTETDIGEEKAKSIAFAHANTTETQVTALYVHTEYDDGCLQYHVEFRIGTTEYEYEIHAANGTILDYDLDIEEDGHHNNHHDTEHSAALITEAEAKAIALKHAGFTEAEVQNLRVEVDYDDGQAEYTVEFRVGNTEYEYEIRATDGKILDFEKDRDD